MHNQYKYKYLLQRNPWFRCDLHLDKIIPTPILNLYLNHKYPGSCHKRQKPQALTPQAPVVRNRQTRKVANAKVRIG